MRKHICLLCPLVTLSLLVLAPARGQPANPYKGPVKTVRRYAARLEWQGGAWKPTPRGLSSVTHYNRRGQLTKEWHGWQGDVEWTRTYRYDAKGRLVEEVTRQAHVSDGGEEERQLYRYDGKGRVTQVKYYRPSDVLQGVHRFAYDEKGRKVAERWYDANGRPTRPRDTYLYDAKGRLVKWVDHDTRGVEEVRLSRHDAHGHVIAEVTQSGEGGEWQNAYRYDAKGRQIESFINVTDGRYDSRYTYAYDGHGNVTEEARYRCGEWIRWLTTKTQYDAAKRPVEATALRPEGGVDRRTTYQYDAEGRVTEEARYGAGNYFDGKTVSTYNSQGQLVEKHNYDGELLNNRSTYQYNSEGQLTTEMDYDGEGQSLGTLTFTYDSEGRKVTQTGVGTNITETWSYAYGEDDVAETYSASDPDIPNRGTVTRYDDEGQMTEVITLAPDGTQSFRVRYEYRSDGLPAKEVKEYGDGSRAEWTDYVYDGSRLVEKRTCFGDGSPRERTQYTYDAAGRQTEAVQDMGQLVDPRESYRYQYDTHGNVTERVTGEITLRYGERYLRPTYVSQTEYTYWE